MHAKPSFFRRLWLAFVAFFRALFDPSFAARLEGLRAPPPPPAAPPADSALQLLAILQREGRLVDFLQEEIAGYSDAEVGAAARVVHSGCRRVLQEYVRLEPIRADAEGARIRIEPGFDPAALRLTGNVTGQPPFSGSLRHHGWRAAEVKLPALAGGQDARIIAPAEVEL